MVVCRERRFSAQAVQSRLRPEHTGGGDGSRIVSASRITSASERSASENVPLSMSAFASRMETQLLDRRLHGLALVDGRLEERDRRLPRATCRIRPSERVDCSRVGERFAVVQRVCLLEPDRRGEAAGAEGDLPEAGDRSRPARVTRLQVRPGRAAPPRRRRRSAGRRSPREGRSAGERRLDADREPLGADAEPGRPAR